MSVEQANQYSERHPHEPAQAPVKDAEGRCLVCALSVEKREREAAEREAGELRERVAELTNALEFYASRVSPRGALARKVLAPAALSTGETDAATS